MKIKITLSALLLTITTASAAADCSPRNCGINSEYQWSVEKCKCIKPCSTKTRKDAVEVKPNLNTFELTKNCKPRNCGINPQYQWSIKECKCIKTCFPKTQKDCGYPWDFKLNPDTCEYEKNCEPRNCGFNPQYQWSIEECTCIKTCFPKTQEDCGDPWDFKLNPVTCQCEINCEPRNCGINPDFVWSTEECKCVYSPTEVLN